MPDPKSFICPLCGKESHEFPAISRFDATINICSDCGVREAMNPFTEDEILVRVKATNSKNQFLLQYLTTIMRKNIRRQYRV